VIGQNREVGHDQMLNTESATLKCWILRLQHCKSTIVQYGCTRTHNVEIICS